MRSTYTRRGGSAGTELFLRDLSTTHYIVLLTSESISYSQLIHGLGSETSVLFGSLYSATTAETQLCHTRALHVRTHPLICSCKSDFPAVAIRRMSSSRLLLSGFFRYNKEYPTEHYLPSVMRTRRDALHPDARAHGLHYLGCRFVLRAVRQSRRSVS